jgi:hypothetical protein
MDPAVNGIKFYPYLGKKWDGDPGNDYTVYRGRKHERYTGSPNSPKPKKGETSEERRQETPRGLFTKNEAN